MSSLFKNSLYKTYICWLDSTRLSPSCEAQNTDRECVNEQNAHTTNRGER